METLKSQRKLVCLNVRKNKKHVKNELKQGFKRKESVGKEQISIGIDIFKERLDIQSHYIDKTQLIFNIRKSGVVYWTL